MQIQHKKRQGANKEITGKHINNKVKLRNYKNGNNHKTNRHKQTNRMTVHEQLEIAEH